MNDDEWHAMFEALTPHAVAVLGNVAFGGDGGGGNQRTLKRLTDFGLIEPFIVADTAGSLRFTITKYTMPVHVHIAFCEWCAAQPDDHEESEAVRVPGTGLRTASQQEERT